MKRTTKSLLLSLCMAFLPLLLLAVSDPFYLRESKSSAMYGPFPVKSGASVPLAGKTYQLRIVGKDRLAFLAPDREIFGPLQMVEGRLVSIGGSMYAFYPAKRGNVPANGPRPVKRDGSKPFIPAPPPRPAPIPVTAETPHRVVPARDLPALPSSDRRLEFSAWLALIDDTPIDWKVDSLSGNDSTMERKTIGADCFWDAFSARIAYSPSVESGDIVPTGVGIVGSSLEDGSGVTLQLGYHRPFLQEGGWTASGGVRGAFRHDKADLKTKTLTGGGVDTNGYVSADYVVKTSSLTINEYALWLDLGLSFSQGVWGLHADFSIQPISEYKIDGEFMYAGKGYSVECDRSTPIAFGLGGWYEYRRIRFFAEAVFGADELFRVGALYHF